MSVTKVMLLSRDGQPDMTVGRQLMDIRQIEFMDYFRDNEPGGLDIGSKRIITDRGELLEIAVQSVELYGKEKLYAFLLHDWDEKTIDEIPGIGITYAERLRGKLRNYCSVPELYKMFLYWKCDGGKLKRFFEWACASDLSRAGDTNITNAVRGIQLKHCLFNNIKIKCTGPYFTETKD